MQHSALDLLFGNQTAGVNPNDPRPNVKPPNTLDQFLGSSGGSLLVNLLSQQGFSRTPQSPFGALGRGLLQTQQQGQQRSRSGLEDELLRARIGLTKRQTQTAGQGQRIVQSAQTLANGNIGFFTDQSTAPDILGRRENRRYPQ